MLGFLLALRQPCGGTIRGMTQDDITIEMARTVRELTERAEERIRSRQLGLLWIDLVDEGHEPSPD